MHLRLILLCLTMGILASCGGAGGPTPPTTGVVELVIANPQVHVGSYHRVEVRIDPAAGLEVEDLTFTIPAGHIGGDVSLSKERVAPATPFVLLLVGPRSGDYELVATETATGTEMARLAFTATTAWADKDTGPSVWFTGAAGDTPFGAAWGGGSGAPQNFAVAPALGVRRVAIVLVDSASQRYTPEEFARTRDAYLDNVARSTTRSAAILYDEMSYGGLAITAEAFGPYSLPGPFGEYIIEGEATGDYYGACVELADDDINYDDFDTVLCVLRTDETPDGEVAAWPYASVASAGPFSTGEGDQYLGVISMSSTWDRIGTISHELGHNLGMGDQYRPDVPMPPPSMGSRNIDAWGLMHADRNLPHVTAAHRMRLGWIDRSWIRNIDFSRAAGPVDEDVELEAIERGAPSAGRVNVLEIRIADGWNYYYEFRKGQIGQIGDRSLPRPGSVLGTDVATGEFLVDRPYVLRLRDDADGDGSVLQSGENYRETDTSDPAFPTDFRVDVTSIEGDVANVRVQYGVLSKPDPSIRPWPSGPGREYQSPDIEVQNARNAADPSLFNVPWAEHPNTIVARVKNRGNLPATDVVVDFYIKGLTTGGAAEVLQGTDTETIGPNATAEFRVTWTPPREGHFCVVARIRPYTTPTGGIAEITGRNNEAQSNYARFISATASPASREGTFVIVGNPFPKRTRVTLVCAQTNPYYRTYFEHRWVTLDPGELRRVNVMFEHAGKFPDRGESGGTAKPTESNRVLLRAHVTDPRTAPAETQVLFDGVQIRVDTGRATKTVITGDDEGVVSGTVRTVDDDEEADGGRAIVSYEDPNSQGRVGHHVVPVVDGMFVTEVPEGWTAIHATYLPSEGLAESDASTTR